MGEGFARQWALAPSLPDLPLPSPSQPFPVMDGYRPSHTCHKGLEAHAHNHVQHHPVAPIQKEAPLTSSVHNITLGHHHQHNS